MNKIEIDLSYLRASCCSLTHSLIPLCQNLAITNTSDEVLAEVQITCQGEHVTSTDRVLASIAAGATIRLTDFAITTPVEKLLELKESLSTTFKLQAKSGEELLFEQDYPLILLPYDHWMGTTLLPQTLAAMVTPKHPSLSALMQKASVRLTELAGTADFHAYQTGNIDDVRQQASALYAALQDEGLILKPTQVPYDEVGQQVATPAQVLQNKEGNSLELTLLYASLLEAAGLHPGIILQQGHACVSLWLVEDCCTYSVCDDVSYVEKKCSRGIDEMMVIEAEQVTRKASTFEQAVDAATRQLADYGRFELLADVHRCRLERFLPLPARIKKGSTWTLDTSGAEIPDFGYAGSKEHDRFDLDHLRDSKHELTKFDIWERKLLDFSLRNSLLNLYLRRKAIQFISFDVDKLEDHLQDGEEYCITARPEVDFRMEAAGQLNRSKLAEPLHALISHDMEHHRLHTYQNETETNSTLKNIYRAARNAIEETGANSLFLAIGTLRWYETPLSSTPRYAPLLLLPVEMVYKRGNYYIRTREEEITLNVTLIEFLRQNYDISIEGLDPLPTDHSGVDVPLIFAIMRNALKEQKRWDVEEECLLGTFSFSKFLMWNDVHNNREQLRENAVVNSLVENHLTFSPEPLTSDLQTADAKTSPASLALPVAVDSSQMAAVIEAGRGSSFILYGPPGTGKSQTITNLIANALYQGKRVLFVAEKMAALSVVQNRLAQIGLAPFCLELHSNKVTKRHVLHQLESALLVAHIVPPSGFEVQAEKLFAQRHELIDYMHALHDVDPEDGLSLYDCMLRYESIEAEPLPKLAPNAMLDEQLSHDGVKSIEEMLGERLRTVVQLVGQPSQHPLRGLNVTQEMLLHPDEVKAQMQTALSYLQHTSEQREELAKAATLRENLLRNNESSLLSADARHLHSEWRNARAKWFLPKYFSTRSLLQKLKTYNPSITASEVDSTLEDLLTYQQLHAAIEQAHRVMRQYFCRAYCNDELPGQQTLAEAQEQLARWMTSLTEMRRWIHWSNYSHELKSCGLQQVVNIMEHEYFTPDTLRPAFLKALFRQKVEQKISTSAPLLAFNGLIFDDKVRAYRQMAEEFRLLTQKELYARLAARIPRVIDHLDSSSEIGLLNRNISNGGRGLSLRDLFDQIPTLLPRLCPCMLMSPMSVARFLNLNQEKFDLVVFDEASQMPTSEAVGAIARGKALVVVGDPRQMPPTSFFSSTTVDEEEAAIDDMESILEDCRTLQVPSLQLNWHYRSKHESLIAFSNHEYYEGSLITFPSVDDQNTKVRFVPVEGYYDKGGKRSNHAEAKAIVNEIANRLREGCKQSLGVIAFSVVQQSLLEDLLQDALEKDPTLREAADALYEPIFVKNLENVQGDERDVILFSIGYGPDREGKVSMNFGPLNNAGGERRLNVAVSRARREMVVFSTLRASQIDLRRSQARGVEGLKHFLEYAENQTLATSFHMATQAADTPLATQIARQLEARGYQIRTQVGRSQFKVDIAICDPADPDVYLLGILLDGKNYRDTQTTRDREIVQPQVLNALNWKVTRVWSMDWYNNPQQVIDRIAAALDTLPTTTEDKQEVKPLTGQPFDAESEPQEQMPQFSEATSYKEYNVTNAYARRLTDRDLVRRIVATEQPISFAELCRRVCSLRGIPRVTPTLQSDLQACLEEGFYTEPDREGTVVWASEKARRSYQGYRTGSGRYITDIPMVEIRNSVLETIAEQFALPTNNLTLLAAKKLGFTRRGTKVDSAFHEAVEQLKAAGEVMETEGTLSLPN